MLYSLDGNWQVELEDGTEYQMILPGTLDENRIGYKDLSKEESVISTRFTRKYTYEGVAKISRKITYIPEKGKRVFLEVERARCLTLFIDGRKVPFFREASISTPYIFEVTDLLTGDNKLTLVSDNSYIGLSHDAIVYSSAATDETQTNWNGLLGFIRLRMENENFISNIRVYPKEQLLTVQVEISSERSYKGIVTVRSEALKEQSVSKEISFSKGIHTVVFEDLSIQDDVKLWDEYEGNLYQLSAEVDGKHEEKTVRFGVRDFGDNGNGKLALNGRTLFLRSEANCAEFPETGYCPMTVKEWITILNAYKSYGVNLMRFHSHCPPEVAFTAADELGMLMQPELSHWNPKDAFESDESYFYYRKELEQIILLLANHPSFVMLTFGNELNSSEKGHKRMEQLLDFAHSLDDTRLYAEGSNVHYGGVKFKENSDFGTLARYFSDDLRGTFSADADKKQGLEGYINNQYPNAQTNYENTMKIIRESYQKPVFSFEVGQFELLPDFDELDEFHGISDPVNFRLIQEKVESLGLTKVWKKYVEATGELARIGYREEIEAAMRTESLSGISLLGLQDFPGQGTALVGMMNSHLQPKPFNFAKPEAFQSFFREQLPLVLLPKYTYETSETLVSDVKIANYGKEDISGEFSYGLKSETIDIKGELPKKHCPKGQLTLLGTIKIPLDAIKKSTKLDLRVNLGEISNTYPIWVYPEVKPICPESVYETKRLDKKAKEILEAGGKVYLSPDSTKANLPMSIQAQFTTDFWSVGTFKVQEGGMGQLIDDSHPIFKDFPTKTYTDWNWWPMANQRAIILPEAYKAIITEMDSYAFMRPMVQLLECRIGKGKLILSSMGLQNLQQYPEARTLLNSIYGYMDTDDFEPKEEIPLETICSLVK